MPNQLDKWLDTPATIGILLGIAGCFLLYRLVYWICLKLCQWLIEDDTL
jgi:hypothetical protein